MSTLDQGYFDWLCSLVEPTRNLDPRRTHQLLLAQLLQTSFQWSVRFDDNREADGKELRSEFLGGFDVDEAWAAADCSILEMLIALSRRAAFESYGGVDDWFWHLLDNLGLFDFTDDRYGEWVTEEVEFKLAVLIHRKYTRDGRGSLFPLQHSNQDQRRTELWNQLAAYVMEGNGPRI